MEFSAAEMHDRALFGLAVFAAIPVVLFALWADYYSRYLKAARKTAPDFDPKLEKDRIRIVQFSVGLFETVLFLGALDISQEYPKVCATLFISSLFFLRIICAGVEAQLAPVQLNPAQPGSQQPVKKRDFGFKALTFGVISGVLYVAILMSFVKAFAWIAQIYHFPSSWGAAFVMLGAGLGIFIGIAFNFALGPWQMKNSLSVRAMLEEELAPLKAVLEKAGLKNFRFWVVDDSAATAAIAGFAKGRGIFQPALFISKKVMDTLTGEELTTVVAHEAAHVLAHHLRKRLLLSASLVISLTFMAIFSTLASYTLLPAGTAQGSIGMLFGCAAFFLAFFVLQRQSQRHEFQADWIAVQKLGAGFDSWASGLRKMDKLNGFPLLPGAISTHPRTEIRIQNVAKMIEFFSELKKAEAKADSKRDDRAA